MWASLTSVGLRILCNRLVSLPSVVVEAPLLHLRCRRSTFMESRHNPTAGSRCFTSSAHSNRSGVRGRGLEMEDNRRRSRGRGSGSSGNDKIDALGRLLTRILRHMASELKLEMRSDGYVKVQDVLKLNLKTFANIPLRSHTIEDVREAVRKDNKQRFSLLEENGELLIRANQGHTIAGAMLSRESQLFFTYMPFFKALYETVETESLLKPIVSPEEVPEELGINSRGGLKRMKRLHVHFSCGLPTDSEVIRGNEALHIRQQVILTEGFDGVVPVKYFLKIESWPKRESIPF
ncbi:putative tRNA 2'-phosphotransferase [Sesamum angolense]|uniref:2'-phosphotransferase n=1 Tax=Sesamum angolense TaxID=2727404 RepID=A0AAE2BT19_9LAMI|nr:putative tRNA 2'-phosphotransferase [Sesamum angolense]